MALHLHLAGNTLSYRVTIGASERVLCQGVISVLIKAKYTICQAKTGCIAGSAGTQNF